MTSIRDRRTPGQTMGDMFLLLSKQTSDQGTRNCGFSRI